MPEELEPEELEPDRRLMELINKIRSEIEDAVPIDKKEERNALLDAIEKLDTMCEMSDLEDRLGEIAEALEQGGELCYEDGTPVELSPEGIDAILAADGVFSRGRCPGQDRLDIIKFADHLEERLRRYFARPGEENEERVATREMWIEFKRAAAEAEAASQIITAMRMIRDGQFK